jgi:hypothetical protein
MSAAQALAQEAARAPSAAARESAVSALDVGIARLTDLASRNAQVSAAEITSLCATRDETLAALASPRVRLDALRLIWRI